MKGINIRMKIEPFNKLNYNLNNTCGFFIWRGINELKYLTTCLDYDICIKNKLKEIIIEQLIVGYNHFIIDLHFSFSMVITDIISELRESYPEIILEAFIFNKSYISNKTTDKILNNCTKITLLESTNSKNLKTVCGKKIFDISGQIIFVNNIVTCNPQLCKTPRFCAIQDFSETL